MNRTRILALCIAGLIVLSSILSFAAAASIVRSASSLGATPVISVSEVSPVLVSSSSCGSTIVRSYTECQRATTYTPRPRAESSFSAHRQYAESPGYDRFPTAGARESSASRVLATNFDSSAYDYDYRGPLYERRIIQSDDFVHSNKARSRFFSSRASDLTTRSVRNEVVEKYVGASESLYATSRNNQVATQENSANKAFDYDGGFSFGKQRFFDESEYGRDSYTEPYYYRPVSTPSGYFNWGY